MTKIELNEKTYNIPSSWEELTCEAYTNLFEDYETGLERDDYEGLALNKVRLISNLLDEDLEFVLDLPITVINRIEAELKFLSKAPNFSEDIKYIELDGDNYYIPSPEDLLFGQMIDAEYYSRDEKDKFSYLKTLCTLLIKDGEKYDNNENLFNKKLELLKKQSIVKVASYLNSFYLKKNFCVKNIQICSEIEEGLLSAVKNIKNSK